MKIPYITIGYDKYWHQLVFGKAIFELSRHNTGCIYWKRLFGIGRPLRPLPKPADTDGLMRFTIYRYDDDRDIIYLAGVFVKKSIRGNGYGNEILALADKIARTMGAKAVCLKAKKDLLAWYQRHGYEIVEVGKRYIWMRKEV